MISAQSTPTVPTAGQRLTGLLATIAVLSIIIGLPALFLEIGANPIPDQALTLQSVKDALLAPDDGTLIRKAGIMGVVRAGGPVRAGDVIGVELPPEPHEALDRV